MPLKWTRKKKTLQNNDFNVDLMFMLDRLIFSSDLLYSTSVAL